jgi:hypothetical protein
MPIREYRCGCGQVTEVIVYAYEVPTPFKRCDYCADVAALVKHSLPGTVKVKGGTPRFHKQAHKTDIDHRVWSEKKK